MIQLTEAYAAVVRQTTDTNVNQTNVSVPVNDPNKETEIQSRIENDLEGNVNQVNNRINVEEGTDQTNNRLQLMEDACQRMKTWIKVLEQRLMMCDELAEQAIMHGSNNEDSEIGLNDAALVSSITSFEEDQCQQVVHSTPVHSEFIPGPNVSEIRQTPNFESENRGHFGIVSAEGEQLGREMSNVGASSDRQSGLNTFSGFRSHDQGPYQSDITVKHINNVIDRIQHRIQDVCRYDSSETPMVIHPQEDPQIAAVLGESEDIVGDLASESPSAQGLRRSRRLRRAPDWFVAGRK